MDVKHQFSIQFEDEFLIFVFENCRQLWKTLIKVYSQCLDSANFTMARIVAKSVCMIEESCSIMTKTIILAVITGFEKENYGLV